MPVDYLPRQAVFVGIGLLLMLIAFSIDYRVLLGLSLPLYLLSLAALVAVLVVGIKAGGSRSWLGIGGWRLQPSEFAKLATALAAGALSRDRQPTLPRLAPDRRRRADRGGADGAGGGASRTSAAPAMFVPMLAGALLVAGVRLRVLVAAA